MSDFNVTSLEMRRSVALIATWWRHSCRNLRLHRVVCGMRSHWFGINFAEHSYQGHRGMTCTYADAP